MISVVINFYQNKMQGFLLDKIMSISWAVMLKQWHFSDCFTISFKTIFDFICCVIYAFNNFFTIAGEH